MGQVGSTIEGITKRVLSLKRSMAYSAGIILNKSWPIARSTLFVLTFVSMEDEDY